MIVLERIIAFLLKVSGASSKLYLYGALAAIVAVLGGGYFGCSKWNKYQDYKKVQEATEQRIEKNIDKGKTAVELNEEYLREQDKKNSLERQLKGDIAEEVKQNLLKDPKFQKLQEEKKRYHLNKLREWAGEE